MRRHGARPAYSLSRPKECSPVQYPACWKGPPSLGQWITGGVGAWMGAVQCPLSSIVQRSLGGFPQVVHPVCADVQTVPRLTGKPRRCPELCRSSVYGMAYLRPVEGCEAKAGTQPNASLSDPLELTVTFASSVRTGTALET
ncbi:hypothetical protein NUW54_g2785 [Trametes sanguinea]|uniref:Uncharacterized protein n=1 Tax=Trametes sanguinea TaxID=158606 RepID=A0ACC1Q3X6_9APHY|nr:hypothetical protein NUW54_g2785 [Trametes sanguinea]